MAWRQALKKNLCWWVCAPGGQSPRRESLGWTVSRPWVANTVTANEGPQLPQLQLAQLEAHTRPLTNEQRSAYPAKKKLSNDSHISWCLCGVCSWSLVICAACGNFNGGSGASNGVFGRPPMCWCNCKSSSKASTAKEGNRQLPLWRRKRWTQGVVVSTCMGWQLKNVCLPKLGVPACGGGTWGLLLPHKARIECKMSINLAFDWRVQRKRLKTQTVFKQDTVRAAYLHWYPILTLRASEAKSPLAPMKRKGACQRSKCKNTEEIDARPGRTLLLEPSNRTSHKRYELPNYLLKLESKIWINN